jgi:hypothetical protein
MVRGLRHGRRVLAYDAHSCRWCMLHAGWLRRTMRHRDRSVRRGRRWWRCPGIRHPVSGILPGRGPVPGGVDPSTVCRGTDLSLEVEAWHLLARIGVREYAWGAPVFSGGRGPTSGRAGCLVGKGSGLRSQSAGSTPHYRRRVPYHSVGQVANTANRQRVVLLRVTAEPSEFGPRTSHATSRVPNPLRCRQRRSRM